MFDFYNLNFAQQDDIANNGTPSDDVQVGNEYDFELVDIRAIINGATDVTGPLLVELKNSGGVSWSENPMDMFSFAVSSGAFEEVSGHPIKVPWSGCVIPSGTKVTANWTNQSGQTLSFQLQLIGRKLFKNG